MEKKITMFFFPQEQKILHLLLLSHCFTTCKQQAQTEWISRAVSQNKTFIPSRLALNSPLHFQHNYLLWPLLAG